MPTTKKLPRKGNPPFEEWSRQWKAARKSEHIEHYKEILDLWAPQNIPRKWHRDDWAGDLGFRKKTKEDTHRGEQKIEKFLLGDEGTYKTLDIHDSQDRTVGKLHSLYHNAALINQRSGQVIADVFGVICLGNKRHPAMIEVKVTDQHPWYALVENLFQVRLARACEPRIRAIVEKKWKIRIGQGAWGIVLAPREYFENRKHQEQNRPACRELLRSLKANTKARVAFATSDHLANGFIQIIESNWS